MRCQILNNLDCLLLRGLTVVIKSCRGTEIKTLNSGFVFGWPTRLWRRSNRRDKWSTCPLTASIKRAEEKTGEARGLKNPLKRVTARETPMVKMVKIISLG
jgi:hypothetical protein